MNRPLTFIEFNQRLNIGLKEFEQVLDDEASHLATLIDAPRDMELIREILVEDFNKQITGPAK